MTERDCGQLFRFNDQILSIQTSRVVLSPTEKSTDSLGTCADYVLKSELEYHFGCLFPTLSTVFRCEDVFIGLERDDKLQISIPERILFVPTKIIDISVSVASTSAQSWSSSSLVPDYAGNDIEIQTQEGESYSMINSVMDIDNHKFATHQMTSMMRGLELPKHQPHANVSPESPQIHSFASQQVFYASTAVERHPHQYQEERRAPQEHGPIASHASDFVLERFHAHQKAFLRHLSIYEKAKMIFSKRVQGVEDCLWPRLFVVLPVVTEASTAGIESSTPEFRIYFLCECGQSSTSDGINKSLPSTHIVDQMGYSIKKLDTFFDFFGPFLLVALETIRLGIDVGGYHFEPLAQSSTRQQQTQSGLRQRVEKAVVFLERLYLNANKTLNEYLENAQDIDLSKVSEFVKDDSFCRLYRVQELNTTNENDLGYDNNVKWLCQQHYQSQTLTVTKTMADDLGNLTKLALANAGFFVPERGRVKACPLSPTSANQIYQAILKVSTLLQELDLILDWNQRYEDLLQLRDLIAAQTHLRILRLSLGFQVGPTFEFSFQGRYNPIFEILQHKGLRSVCLQQINGLWSRSIHSDPVVELSRARQQSSTQGSHPYQPLATAMIPDQEPEQPHPQYLYAHLKQLWIVLPPIQESHKLRQLLHQAPNLKRLEIVREVEYWPDIIRLVDIVIRSRTSQHTCPTYFVSRDMVSHVPLLAMTIPIMVESRMLGEKLKFAISQQEIEKIHATTCSTTEMSKRSEYKSFTEFIHDHGHRFEVFGLSPLESGLAVLVQKTTASLVLQNGGYLVGLKVLMRDMETIRDGSLQQYVRLLQLNSGLQKIRFRNMCHQTSTLILDAIPWTGRLVETNGMVQMTTACLTTLELTFLDSDPNTGIQQLLNCLMSTSGNLVLKQVALAITPTVTTTGAKMVSRWTGAQLQRVVALLVNIETLFLEFKMVESAWLNLVNAIDFTALKHLGLANPVGVVAESMKSDSLAATTLVQAVATQAIHPIQNGTSPSCQLDRLSLCNFGAIPQENMFRMSVRHGIQVDGQGYKYLAESLFI